MAAAKSSQPKTDVVCAFGRDENPNATAEIMA